jgi:hypothetical protein
MAKPKIGKINNVWGPRAVHRNVRTRLTKATRDARKPGPVTIIRPGGA